MADWSLPQLSDLKVDVLSMLKGREVDAYTLAENALNPPVGAIRWNRTLHMFQSWDGTAWHDLIIAIVGGGTGGSNIDEVLDSLNLGTMSTQNSNAVNITGGSITGVSPLSTTGNLTVGGVITAGSGPTTITDSSGKILDTALGPFVAHTNINEIITGAWTFNATVYTGRVNIHMGINLADTFIQRLSIGENTANPAPAIMQSGEGGLSVETVIVANNWYSPDGGQSRRVNLNNAGSALRLGRNNIILFGVNAAGAAKDFLYLAPTLNISYADTFEIGRPGVSLAQFTITANDGGNIFFNIAGVTNGAILVRPGALYYDANTHYWRSSAGASYGNFNANGTFAANGGLWPLNGNIYNPQGNAGLIVDATINSYISDDHIWKNGANNVQYAQLNNLGFYCTPRLQVAGIQGTGVGIWKSGVNAVFSCHQGDSANGSTSWHNATDTVQLMVLTGNTLTPHGGLALNAGSTSIPTIRFISAPDTGIYYNPTLLTAEFGASFSKAYRSVVRCFNEYSAGKVDVYIGTATMISFDGQRGVCAGVDAGFHLGVPTARWHTVFALTGTINTSDIRLKDIHGDLNNALPFVDAIQPIIGSFKEELRPETMKNNVNWGEHFPTFSAQDIKDRIDNVLGTRIVDDTNPDQLGMNYSRLVPVLWQAVRELYARVKALEP